MCSQPTSCPTHLIDNPFLSRPLPAPPTSLTTLFVPPTSCPTHLIDNPFSVPPTSCPTHLIDKPVGDQVFGQVFREFPFLQLGGEVALEFVVKEKADVKLGEGRGGERRGGE